jgi:hypothetical protein
VNDPVYELDFDTGVPYDNLLQLRARKVTNFLSIPESWNLYGFGVIQYDSLIGDKFDVLRRQIATAMKANMSCPLVPSFIKEPYNLSNDVREYVATQSNWNVEKQIGFHP